ncbi:MAG: T9SS type A sorting domain-containing protein [Bacteroidota bacterium]|nr:T9SS type A sorting domain-containing protein [Bacteroidota bacterium]
MKKAIHYIQLLIIFLIATTTFAQQNSSYQKSKATKKPLARTVNVSDIKNDYKFNIQYLEMPSPCSGSYKTYLRKLKEEMPAKKYSNNSPKANRTIDAPNVLTDFEGNIFNGHIPNDNDIAISNNGIIVSVINSVIYFFNSDSMINNAVSLKAFASDSIHTEGKFDPRIIYDPTADRFILTFLNGFDDKTSCLFLAFSQTNDPTGNWNIYTLQGNPLSDSSWSDFPMIAITENELFYTINLLRNTKPGENWKNTFKQTIIWQIDKSTGYKGDSLKLTFYHDIEFEATNIRNLCPVQGGSYPTTPNMYFLSNRNFSLECDSIFVVEITGELNNAQTKLNISLSLSDSNYGVPPLADQPINRKFETNDARILDSYIENNEIHFVGNSINFYNNFASIYHGIISNLSTTKNVHLNIVKHPYLEFGYPSIAYTGSNSNDEAIILTNHSSDTINPGISTFFYKNKSYSEIKRIKEGETRVTLQSQAEQRWGDYTGLQRKYNENIVWGCGYYGKLRNSTPRRVNGTWIFALQSPSFSTTEQKPQSELKTISFPNPASNFFYLEFENNKKQILDFYLYDINGKIQKHFMRERIKIGKNALSFDVSPLKNGVYFLIAKNNDEVVLKERIVIQK